MRCAATISRLALIEHRDQSKESEPVSLAYVIASLVIQSCIHSRPGHALTTPSTHHYLVHRTAPEMPMAALAARRLVGTGSRSSTSVGSVGQRIQAALSPSPLLGVSSRGLASTGGAARVSHACSVCVPDAWVVGSRR